MFKKANSLLVTVLIKQLKTSNLYVLLQSNPPLTEMDPLLPAASQPSDVLMSPPDDFLIDPIIEPASSQSESKPASEVMSEPSDFEDLTNNLIDSPVDSGVGESSAADTTKSTTEVPSDEPTEEFVDIFGSETEAAEEEVVANVTVKAVSDKSEVTSGTTDQHSDGKTGSKAVQELEEASAAPVMDFGSELSAINMQQPQVGDKIVDPLVDLLSEAPLTADTKKPSKAAVDLFDDEGSDLFAEPRQNKSAKQPQTSLFGEPDEDLFGEPLSATSKKTASKEQQNKSVTTKASESNIGGPLQDSKPTEPADIFSEEAVTTVPSAVKSKTNGLHSEEETDIFAGRFSVVTHDH